MALSVMEIALGVSKCAHHDHSRLIVQRKAKVEHEIDQQDLEFGCSGDVAAAVDGADSWTSFCWDGGKGFRIRLG